MKLMVVLSTILVAVCTVHAIASDSVAGNTMYGRGRMGRGDAHGDNPGCTTYSYFNHILIDYSQRAVLLLPRPEGGPAAAPPTAPDRLRANPAP
ncbi:MAG: hypothetical protein JXR37_04995 [Kiritimatiellae bacterium]|nr:hypothetical protein [Kiritimatiellia bacterium]